MLEIIEFSKERITKNPDGSKRVRKRVVCKCICGNVSDYDYYSVKSKRTKTCINCSRKINGKKRRSHGKSKHPLYRKWQDMKNRCYNKNVDRYKVYGGRGIKVCSDWKKNFQIFYDWCIDNGWEKGNSIDRIFVNGNYEPNNCRITSFDEQKYNLQNTFYVSYKEKIYCLAEICNVLSNRKLRQSAFTGIKYKGKTFEYYIEKKGLLNELEKAINKGLIKNRSEQIEK